MCLSYSPRSIIPICTRSLGDLEVTDSALEHTAATSARFYQLNDRHQKVKTFVKGYSLSLKNTRAPGPEGTPAPMEEDENSDSGSQSGEKMADAANMSADSHHDDFELGDEFPIKTPPDSSSEDSGGTQSESECEDSELGPEYSETAESDFEAEPNRKKKKLKIKHQESPPLRSFANLNTCTRPLPFSLRSHTTSVRMFDPSKKITEDVAKRLLGMLQIDSEQASDRD